MQEAQFEVRVIDKIAIIRLFGEVIYNNEHRFVREVKEAIVEVKTVIFDLTEATYLSSTILGLLFGITKTKKLLIVNSGNATILNSLNLVSLPERAQVFGSVITALHSLGVDYYEEN